MSQPNPKPSKQRAISSFFTPVPKKTNHEGTSAAKHTPQPGTNNSSKGVSSEPPPSSLEGKRIRVYWKADEAWYSGRVASFDSLSGKHKVCYDDGDVEELQLDKEKYELDENEENYKTPVPQQKAPVARHSKSISKKKKGDDSDWEITSDDGDDEEEEGDAMDLDASEEEGDEDENEAMETGTRKRPQSQRRNGGSSTVKRTRVGAEEKTPMNSKTPSTAFQDLTLGTTNKNPKPAAVKKFKSALEVGEDIKKAVEMTKAPLVTGVEATMGPDADRFLQRASNLFPWLRPDKIKDAYGKKPTDKGYDPSSVFIPDGWFKKHNISEGQKQWWEFKKWNFDSILMFKMGKFYELFEMDSHVGVDVLNIQYMKGDQPHCGFPEAAYHQYAEALARAGYKVVVIEQTETPEMMRQRNAEAKQKKLPKSHVVRREKVAVLTKGTLRDAQMVQSHPDPAYLMAVIEIAPTANDFDHTKLLGICAVDVASTQMMVGQFRDDELMAHLRTYVAGLRPAEFLLPAGEAFLSAHARKLIKSCQGSPRINTLPIGEKGFLNAFSTAAHLKEYFSGEGCDMGTDSGAPPMPEILQELVKDTDKNVSVLHAIGAVVEFLKGALIDRSFFPLAKVERLGGGQDVMVADYEGPKHILLDSSALENLEVLQNSEGGVKGSLLSVMDQCKTPFGRRLLRHWLCRPLGRVSEIHQRQKAIRDLTEVAVDNVGEAKKFLAGIGDLERALARLHTSTLSGVHGGRDAEHVILYEDTSKKKVNALVAAIRGLESAQQAVLAFQPVLPELSSSLLKSIVTPGLTFPDLDEALLEMQNAADWEMAQQSGQIIPGEGIVPGYDQAKKAEKRAKADLDAYLQKLRSIIGGQIKYVSVNKESHLIEVPDSLLKRVPGDFNLTAQRKGFKRYMSDELRELVNNLDASQADLEKEMANLLQGLVKKFASQHQLWSRAVEATSQLDALISLATACLGMEGGVCCPEFVDPVEGAAPVFSAKGMRHPCVGGASGTFVPNDVDLGGQGAGLMLLTGPNMGGKSMLIRQVCLATVLAQVGAFVPAESLRLSPIDAIFVRMGARDDILSSQSTFFVELSETAAMLRKATKNSLVALDELGRGTATSDGAAIASAVLDHVSRKVGCRGVFATHYHDLSREHSHNSAVSIKHMACHVTPSKTGVEEVTFLYKVVEGACPKSYGMNVAKLAGLPSSVVEMAAEISADMERKRRRDVESVQHVVQKMRAWNLPGNSASQEEMMESIAQMKQKMCR
ncbi:hypothetical protein BSKO_01488 [Bryopsis sp. KO-2023]|nr:hypothetical protein BSKO_01488 [Bryopsis sp. KO-2023]